MILTQCHSCGPDLRKFVACPLNWKRVIQSLQNLVAVFPGRAYSLINLWMTSAGMFCQFFQNFGCVFLKVKHSTGDNLRIFWSDLCVTKMRSWVGYGVSYTYVAMTLTSTMTFTLNFSMSKFEIAECNNCCSDWSEVKRKQIVWIRST